MRLQLIAVATELKEKFGKGWRNNEVDNVHAAKYFIRYRKNIFDTTFILSGYGVKNTDVFCYFVNRSEYQQFIDHEEIYHLCTNIASSRYFDQNNNAAIDFGEFQSTIEKDQKSMEMKVRQTFPLQYQKNARNMLD